MWLKMDIIGIKVKENIKKKTNMYVGFKVLTSVVMKSSVFWNIMLYSPLKSLVPASCSFLAWLILQP
jgi:hypothetical protein